MPKQIDVNVKVRFPWDVKRQTITRQCSVALGTTASGGLVNSLKSGGCGSPIKEFETKTVHGITVRRGSTILDKDSQLEDGDQVEFELK